MMKTDLVIYAVMDGKGTDLKMRIDNRKIAAVVSDFDGTLLAHGQPALEEGFFDLMEELFKREILFVAASGRQYANLRKVMAPVADRIGYIAENGALVAWGAEILQKSTVDRELGMALIADMQAQPHSEILVSGAGTSYIVPNSREYADALEGLGNVVTELEDFADVGEGMLKISIFYPEGIPQEAERRLREKYGDRLLVVRSGNGWLDFMPKESGKGTGLRLLMEKLGIPLEQVVAFGDSENDISMLQEAGIAYAMEKAEAAVLTAADHVCGSVPEVLRSSLEMCS